MFSAFPDATLRILSVSGVSFGQVVHTHESAVTGLSLHATGNYLLTPSDGHCWAFSDTQTSHILTKVMDET